MIPPETPRTYGPEYLRGRAQEYRDMAATATNEAKRDDLLRLAERFEALAVTLEKDRWR
jgi:hypothetical protein